MSRDRGIQPLATDFVIGLIANIGLKMSTKHLLDSVHYFDHRQRSLVGEVEGAATKAWSCRQLFCEMHVGSRTVFHVEVVSYELPIRAYDWALPTEQRSNGAGHDAIPVQVATAIKVST